MLQYLRIRNLALLDEVTLEMEPGFTAVTGETGAGKSVLLGALSLLSGGRADKTMIRQGADQLEVEVAIFFSNSTTINELLESLGLPCCEEGLLLLKRYIHREKMPRIQINGSMATLTQLKALGESWIDFHGPGEPQKLFKERFQLEMLDLYADNADRMADYRGRYQQWCELLEAIKQLQNSDRLTDDESDYLREQIRQIDSLALSVTAVEDLERNYTRISSAQEFVSLAFQCSEGLLGEQGIADQLNQIVGQYEALAGLDDAAVALLERVRSLSIELQDLGEETERLTSNFDFDAEAVEHITEQMNLWQEMRRKHGGSVEAVLEKREAMACKLATQGDTDALLKEKQTSVKEIEASLRKSAAELRTIRETATKSFIEKSKEVLLTLGFKEARLEVEFIEESELKDFGDSRCSLLFSPNAGQTPLPLNKIASSGEMARVMLALKTVLAEADQTPLLVFDEVDANVGGEIGRIVGQELDKLSGKHQIFCVTHLPQVASLAQSHLVVTKLLRDGKTGVSIEPIQGIREKRLNELARMLGNRHSASARTHAEELLNSSFKG